MTTPDADEHQRSGKVLVVDDEVHIRQLICRSLANAGFSCAAAADANAALRFLAKHEVDLVTLDIRMPGRSGTDLLRELTEKYPDVAVVMLTGHCDTKVAIDALTYGASAYLTKPIDFSELIFHVRRGLERRNLILQQRRYTERLEETVARQTAAIREAHEETILRLVKASVQRDEETGAHIRRVGLSSEILAHALGWSATETSMMRIAAPMHDVGKIGIPDAILRKPSRLSHAEYEIMKTHTTIGASMLAESTSPMLRLAEQIARSHHERWDGSGYPEGLSGREIPEAARIVAIVDVYDALTHDRIYRPALPEEEALKIMKEGAGTNFDPEVLDLFFTVLPEVREVRRLNPDELAFQNLVSCAGAGFAADPCLAP